MLYEKHYKEDYENPQIAARISFSFLAKSVCRLSVVCLSVTLVHPTQGVEISGNISTPFGTLAIL